MKMRVSARTWIALLLTLIVFGFAPLFHAMCIGQVNTKVHTHLMADGTIMSTMNNMAHANHVMPQASHSGVPFSVVAQASAASPLESWSLSVGALHPGQIMLLLVPAIIVLLLCFWLAKPRGSTALHRCQRILFRGLRPPQILHRPTMVDLISLGISRT